MNLDQIETKCFILALFIRDDGERFLLGSRAYEFVDSQLHFTANAYQNDIVEVQGNDGVMLAGQVRRGQSQAFDGYIGDASVDKSTIEQYRQNFLKFFRKNHYYKVVYIFTDGSAIQRRQGFIVEAPEVKELYQLFPQYHISMNFEDINYYNYDEDSEGEEIYGESATLNVATSATGGLIWEDGSETTLSGEGSNFTLNGTIDGNGISNVQLKGDTTQQTYSGKNLLSVLSATGTNSGIIWTRNVNSITVTGSSTNTQAYRFMDNGNAIALPTVIPAGTYTLSRGSVSGAGSGQTLNFQFRDANNNVLLSNQRLGANTPSITITLTSDAYYFRVAIEGLVQNTSVNIAYNDIQLEAGSTMTSYEPYVGGIEAPNPDYPQPINVVTGEQTITIADDGQQSQEYTVSLGSIELCKIGTYQDYIYKSGDDWYVHKATTKYTFDGSDDEQWGLATNSRFYCNANLYNGGVLPATNADNFLAYCDCLTPMDYNTSWNSTTNYTTSVAVNNTSNPRIVNKDYNTLDNFKSWLATSPVTLYYPLATATDTQITNTALISQLNALAGATTYDGQTVFTVTSENQLGILSLSSLVIAGGGVVWDNYGAEWEEGTGGGPTMIDVDSIDNVYPVWELKGPAVNPQISVLTTNTTLTYTGSITASQTLSIDMFNKTATLNGTSVIGNVSGDWVYLKPGINRVTYTTNNADAPDSTIWWQEIVG